MSTNQAKHPGGRPIEWTKDRIESLLNKFESYIEETKIPIIAEFAYKNDVNRQWLYELDKFSDALKKCVQKKEAVLEKLSLENEINVTMAIFSLKQLGWRDRQEIDMNNDVTINVNLIGDKKDGK